MRLHQELSFVHNMLAMEIHNKFDQGIEYTEIQIKIRRLVGDMHK
jgi:hypothetical protein